VFTVDAADTRVITDSAEGVNIPNVPPQAFGGGWVLYPNAVKPWGKKRKEEDEWAEDTRARRQALEEAIQALQPPQERQTVRLPYTAPPPAAVVGVEAAQALQALREDIVGHVSRAQVRASIERAQKAVDEEMARKARVRKNNEFLLFME
jgi:hypothetical protein